MKVLHLAPLWFPVARDSPGGIETYLPTLMRALDDLGCRSTLLSTADSRAEAELIPSVERNLWDGMAQGDVWEYQPYEQHQLITAIEMANEYDVIHSHLGYGGLVLSAVPGVGGRVLHTQHNAVTQDLEWFVERHPDLTMSTVSELQAQRLRARGASVCHVIPNGIDVTLFPFGAGATGGLAFVGRMEEEKGADIAVRVARELELELTLAGPMSDHEFFDSEIRPWLSEQIRYVGPLDHDAKTNLLGDAGCVLMPSRWEEPFGLVAVEAMACGTPVVALANGALPEVIGIEVGGFVAADEAELLGLTRRALGLDRARVRAAACRRFDIRAVAQAYLELYATIADTAPVTSA